MESEKAEKGVWVFPIYKDGNKKYIPFFYSLLLAYIIPTLTVLLLSPFARKSSEIYQIEYIMIAVMFCFTGILTRSKLRGFLNLIPAFASYLTIELVLQSFFSPPLANPYGIFNIISEPLKVAITNLNLDQSTPILINVLNLLLVIDLAIIGFISFWGGLFASTISTGFWDKKGDLKFISVIAKAIAIPFAIIILIFLPISLHAVGSVAGGVSYLAAGGTELAKGFGLDINQNSTGQQSNGFSIENIDIDALRVHSETAANYFSLADISLAQLKGNFLVGLVLENFVDEAYRNVTTLLDAVGVLSEVTYVIPELFLGFQNFQIGFEKTFQLIGEEGIGSSPSTTNILNSKIGSLSQTVTYNPDFAIGLENLRLAFENFTLAWYNNETKRGLRKALERVENFEDFQQINSIINLDEFLSALDVAISSLLSLKESVIPFINGTYKTTLGLTALGLNSFEEASLWIQLALDDFTISNQSLAAIPIPDEVRLSIHPPNSEPTSFEIPIAGLIRISADLNNLLLSFGYGALNGIDFVGELDSMMTNMDNLNMSDTTQTGQSSVWTPITDSLITARFLFNNANNNISSAKSKIDIILGEYQTNGSRYGSFLDPAFLEGDDAFFVQIQSLINQYQINMTDFNFLLDGIGYTAFAFRDFSIATGGFDDAAAAYATNNTAFSEIEMLYELSQANATNAWMSINQSQNINPETKIKWLDSLGFLDPGSKNQAPINPPTDSIPVYNLRDTDNSTVVHLQAAIGRAWHLIYIIKDVGSSTGDIQFVLDLLEELDLGAIFGTTEN